MTQSGTSKSGFGGIGAILLSSSVDRIEMPYWLLWVDPWITWAGIIIGFALIAFALPEWYRQLVYQVTVWFPQPEPQPQRIQLLSPRTQSRKQSFLLSFLQSTLRLAAFIVAIILIFALAFWGISVFQGKLVTIQDPLNTGSIQGEWRQHEFDLLREQGSELHLGRCPGPECFFFILGKLEATGGRFVQEFEFGGQGIGVYKLPDSVLVKSLIYRRGGTRIDFGVYPLLGYMPMKTESGLEICSSTYDLRVTLIAIAVDSITLSVDVKSGTNDESTSFDPTSPGSSPPDECPWLYPKLWKSWNEVD